MWVALGVALSLGAAIAAPSPSRAQGLPFAFQLTQVGGTYDPALGAQDGDTLELQLDFSIRTDVAPTLIDPGITAIGGVGPGGLDVTESTEISFVFVPQLSIALAPVVFQADIEEIDPPAFPVDFQADGWELSAGLTNPTVFAPVTVPLGTVALVLDGTPGTVSTQFGTSLGGVFFPAIIGNPWEDAFFEIVPEPSTAVLLALGLAGFVIRRRRRV